MIAPLLIVGGVSVPFLAAGDVKQDLDFVPGDTNETRMMSGTLDIQGCWDSGKYRTTISGSGWVKPGFDAVNFRSAVTIHCIEPLTVTDADTTVQLPIGGYRTDTGYTAFAEAVVDGELVDTSISINGGTGVATLGSVAGADAYRVTYWPILSFKCAHKSERDASSRRYNWTITGEQI